MPVKLKSSHLSHAFLLNILAGIYRSNIEQVSVLCNKQADSVCYPYLI